MGTTRTAEPQSAKLIQRLGLERGVFHDGCFDRNLVAARQYNQKEFRIHPAFGQRIRLGLIALSASLVFLFLVTNIPTIQLQTNFGDFFLFWVAAIFLSSVFAGVFLKLEWVLVFLLFAAVVFPLTEVTLTGSYNVCTTGLLFGTLFRIRPSQIHLQKSHLYLFAALFALGLYYNSIPVLFGDNDGFHNKLWAYNFLTFLKYIFIGLLIIQSNISLNKLLVYMSWFAFGYALFVIIDAYHIPIINIWMKSFTNLAQRPYESSVSTALSYFRSSGLAFDANHAGTALSFLTIIALHQYKIFKLSWLLIPLLLVAVFLTGSRSAAILTVAAFLIWFTYHQEFRVQLRLTTKYLVISLLIVFIGLFNDSFEQVAEMSIHRITAVVTEESRDSDKSLAYRINEIKEVKLTLFGDRSDNLAGVHSQLVRTLRFYGLFGMVVSTYFWVGYIVWVRFSFVSTGLVTLLFLTSYYKWTFHIEAFFIPVLFISVMAISECRKVNEEPSISASRRNMKGLPEPVG